MYVFIIKLLLQKHMLEYVKSKVGDTFFIVRCYFSFALHKTKLFYSDINLFFCLLSQKHFCITMKKDRTNLNAET